MVPFSSRTITGSSLAHGPHPSLPLAGLVLPSGESRPLPAAPRAYRARQTRRPWRRARRGGVDRPYGALVVYALSLIGDESDEALVVKGLDDPHPGLRFRCVYALGKLGCKGAVGEVRRLATEPVAEVESDRARGNGLRRKAADDA